MHQLLVGHLDESGEHSEYELQSTPRFGHPHQCRTVLAAADRQPSGNRIPPNSKLERELSNSIRT
jgi:hypothetical protein